MVCSAASRRSWSNASSCRCTTRNCSASATWRKAACDTMPCRDIRPHDFLRVCYTVIPTDTSSENLQQVLERYWGYTTFRPLQREAMAAIVGRRDSLVVMPTGAGKSLCFQAPALLDQGMAVVVSPLISLMKDQVDTLVGNGVAAACYNSSLASDQKASVAAGVRE